MEALHYGRVAATGWLFLLVLLASLWATDAEAWYAILTILSSDRVSLALAAAAAVAGLGGPPAVGILLDRLAALILFLVRGNMWNLPFNEQFGGLLASSGTGGDAISPSGAFHCFFYTHADSRLIDWMRRRTTQVYGSLTAALAVLLALLSAWLLDSFSIGVTVVSVLIVLALLTYAVLVTRAISETGKAWVSTIGRRAVAEYEQGSRGTVDDTGTRGGEAGGAAPLTEPGVHEQDP